MSKIHKILIMGPNDTGKMTWMSSVMMNEFQPSQNLGVKPVSASSFVFSVNIPSLKMAPQFVISLVNTDTSTPINKVITESTLEKINLDDYDALFVFHRKDPSNLGVDNIVEMIQNQIPNIFIRNVMSNADSGLCERTVWFGDQERLCVMNSENMTRMRPIYQYINSFSSE